MITKSVHPPVTLARGPKAPTVYWDALGLVAAMSLMMVLFICGAITVLFLKVSEVPDECEELDIELEDRDRPGAVLLVGD